MKCQSCGYEGMPNLEETGPHTKAICQNCDKYIKMISKDELEALIYHTPSPSSWALGLKIWTAQYQYKGKDRIDVTVKSAVYPWSVFAPTWEMVKRYKQNEGTYEAKRLYVEQYQRIVGKAFELRAKELADLIKSDRTITLVCFCKSGDFCHRILLAQYFAALGATYYGER